MKVIFRGPVKIEIYQGLDTVPAALESTEEPAPDKDEGYLALPRNRTQAREFLGIAQDIAACWGVK